MEAELELKMEEAMTKPKVQGIICANMSGLSMGRKGIAPENLSGPIAALCDEASKHWASLDSPVIVLETTGKTPSSDANLLVKMTDGVCTGIIKST